MKTVKISKGNSKMGHIPSVSLPPVTTCPKNAPCKKLCYAAKLARFRSNVRGNYENNLTIYKENPQAYFDQISAAAKFTTYFRYHVAGDIPDIQYLFGMVKTANENPHCHFLAFTKQYKTVNEYLTNGGTIPENLKIIFSRWGNYGAGQNPHNLPQSQVIFKGTTPAENWKICCGNCAECACRGIGCWELKPGETIAFYQH